MKENKWKKLEELEDDFDGKILNKADHQKLLKCVGLELPKNDTTAKAQKRSETSKNVSLFSLHQIDKSGSNNKLDLNQLLKNVPESDRTQTLKTKIKKVGNNAMQLSAPLPKPISERIQRKVEYKKTYEEVGKWDHIVQKQRKAPHLSFPLNQEPFRMKTVDEFFKPKAKFLTPLEKEMYALLSDNKCVERPNHDLTVMEEKVLAAMSLEEATARLNKLRKHKALLSYHEAKAKRQKKIKSRHYHKMLKKQRLKENSKLPPVEIDPEESERVRALERASLRHRKGSKWSNRMRIATKTNEKLKFDLEEQRRKHLQLMEKQPQSDSESDEEPAEKVQEEIAMDFFNALKPVDPIPLPSFAKNNPWLHNSVNSLTKKDQHVDSDFVQKEKSCDAVETEKQQGNGNLVSFEKDDLKQLRKWLNSGEASSQQQAKSKANFKSAISKLSNLQEPSDKDHSDDEIASDRPDEDGLCESIMEVDDQMVVANNKVCTNSAAKMSVNNDVALKGNIDFSHVSSSKSISYLKPKLVEDDEDQKMTIEEAFADDDVVAEFQAAKDEVINELTKDDDINSDLPGWGSWGGSGIRKKKKKTVKKQRGERRRDINLGHVIINDKRDVHIAKHQVHSLPYPFVNKDQFESSIARPVGNTWNTPEVFSTAIKPRVECSMGTIIPPMNSSELNTKQDESNIKKRKFYSGKTYNV